MMNGQAVFSPDANYHGTGSFSYTVSDGHGGSATGSVTVTINSVNDAPVANAGTDQTVECSNAVMLDGSASFDVDGDTLTYVWREGMTVIATGSKPDVALPFGTHTLTLRVEDPSGVFHEDNVIVNVLDNTAPVMVSNGETVLIWPPNKRYEQVKVSDLIASAGDSCDASVKLSSVVIMKVGSDEGSASDNDIVIAGDCRSVQLRADRNGNGDGRVYTITFGVTDGVGHTTTLTRQVFVPHNQGGGAAIYSGAAYTVTSSCP
jgi:hypothetical protein